MTRFDALWLATALALVGCSRPELVPAPPTPPLAAPSLPTPSPPAGLEPTGPRLPGPSAPPLEALEVAVGERVSCARFADGGVRCWGTNAEGRAGIGDTPYTTRPARVEGIPPARALAVGARHACIVDEAGRVHCWGYGEDGQLGDGTTVSRPRPAPVEGLEGVVEIDASDLHTCARTSAGEVYCWGRGSLVGDGTDRSRSRPTRVVGLDDVARLELGPETSCAVRTDRSLWCWGFATTGVFGPVAGPFRRARHIADLQIREIALGDAHVCVTDESGVLFCAGHDRAGELIDQWVPDDAECETRDRNVTCGFYPPEPPHEEPPPGSPPPPDIWPPPARPERVRETRTFPDSHGFAPAHTQSHTLEVQADGRYHNGRTCLASADGVRCWGALHRADWGHRGYAPPIPGTEGVVLFDVGPSHGCAVRAGGEVVCWGENHSGELGDGTTDSRDVAAPIVW